MPRTDKVTLKAFWEAVERRLTVCSVQELRVVLRAMAQQTLPTGRQAFLDTLHTAEETGDTVQQALRQDALLADIDDLMRELQAETKRADSWEERHGYGNDYDEEDSLGPYEEFVGPLTALFERVEAVFDYGNLPLARAAYEKLFKLFELEDDYGRGVQPDDLMSLDVGEARARFLRAVYETTPPARRSTILFEQMQQARSWVGGSCPMLNDLLQVSPKPLSDWEQFLTDWIALLRTRTDREADAWLREAIHLSQGTQGLETLARTEGKAHPRAYLDWLAALKKEGRHREVLAAAQEALQTLSATLPIRAAIADYLCAAAAHLKETQALRSGRWEAFAAKPTLARLLDLWDVASSEADRTGLMRQAAQHIKHLLAHPPSHREITEAFGEDDLEVPAWVDKSVLAHAYLLGEEWGAAHQLAARDQVLGWSSSDNPQGLVVPFFLVLLSEKKPAALPSNLTHLWQRVLQQSIGFGFWSEEEEAGPLNQLECTYTQAISQASLSNGKPEKILSWCVDVAKRRVSAIVEEKRRSSYDKAAMLIAACAEVLQLRGNNEAAGSLLNDVRNRFPRHRAFQAELNAAIQSMERKTSAGSHS